MRSPRGTLRSLAPIAALLAVACADCRSAPDPTDGSGPPPCEAPATVLPGSDVSFGGNLAVDDTGIYFTGVYPGNGDNFAPVLFAPFDGGPLKTLGTVEVAIFGFGAAIDDAFYWSGVTTDKGGIVMSIPLAGGAVSILGKTEAGCGPRAGFALDADNAYAGCSNGTLTRVPRKGGAATVIPAGGEVLWVESHDGAVFFVASDAGGIALKRIAGSGDPTVVAHVAGAFPSTTQLAFDDANAYVFDESSLIAVPLDGSPQKTIATALPAPSSLAADASGVYVATEGEPPQILRVRDGEAPVVMATLDLGYVWQLKLDATTLYWTGLAHVGHVGKCTK